MALFLQVFPRAGVAPDRTALANAIRSSIGDPFYLEVGVVNGAVRIEVQKPTAWTGPQITAVQAAVDAAANATPQSDAQNFIDNMPIFEKALCLALIDQLNVIRAALTSPLPPITPAQAIAAVRAKAGTL